MPSPALQVADGPRLVTFPLRGGKAFFMYQTLRVLLSRRYCAAGLSCLPLLGDPLQRHPECERWTGEGWG